MFSIKDKRQDMRFTKQISVTRLIKPPFSIPCFAYILEKRDFDWGGGTIGAGGGGGGLAHPVI
jgi:hypothetical protein